MQRLYMVAGREIAELCIAMYRRCMQRPSDEWSLDLAVV